MGNRADRFEDKGRREEAWQSDWSGSVDDAFGADGGCCGLWDGDDEFDAIPNSERRLHPSAASIDVKDPYPSLEPAEMTTMATQTARNRPALIEAPTEALVDMDDKSIQAVEIIDTPRDPTPSEPSPRNSDDEIGSDIPDAVYVHPFPRTSNRQRDMHVKSPVDSADEDETDDEFGSRQGSWSESDRRRRSNLDNIDFRKPITGDEDPYPLIYPNAVDASAPTPQRLEPPAASLLVAPAATSLLAPLSTRRSRRHHSRRRHRSEQNTRSPSVEVLRLNPPAKVVSLPPSPIVPGLPRMQTPPRTTSPEVTITPAPKATPVKKRKKVKKASPSHSPPPLPVDLNLTDTDYYPVPGAIPLNDKKNHKTAVPTRKIMVDDPEEFEEPEKNEDEHANSRRPVIGGNVTASMRTTTVSEENDPIVPKRSPQRNVTPPSVSAPKPRTANRLRRLFSPKVRRGSPTKELPKPVPVPSKPQSMPRDASAPQKKSSPRKEKAEKPPQTRPKPTAPVAPKPILKAPDPSRTVGRNRVPPVTVPKRPPFVVGKPPEPVTKFLDSDDI